MGDSWVPIDKEFRKLLPKNRPYTEIEAAFCLQLDADDNKPVSVAGYANLWQWNRKTVMRFIEKMGVTIIYPIDTKSKQNQRGYLKKSEKIIVNLGADRGTDKGQIKGQISFININYLKENRDRSRDRCRDRSRDTTIDPINPNPKKKIFVDANAPTPKEIKKTFTEDSVEYQLSDYLLQRILKINTEHKRPDLRSWAGHIDLMLRIDGRNTGQVKTVINWVFDGESKDALFWQGNILSTKKLREQFDRLSLQMNGSSCKSKGDDNDGFS